MSNYNKNFIESLQFKFDNIRWPDEYKTIETFNNRLNDVKTNGRYSFQIKLEIYENELLVKLEDELYFDIAAIDGSMHLIQSKNWTNRMVVYAIDDLKFKREGMFFMTENKAFRLSLFMSLIKPLVEKPFINGHKHRNGNQIIYFNSNYEFSSQGSQQTDKYIGWTYLHFL